MIVKLTLKTLHWDDELKSFRPVTRCYNIELQELEFPDKVELLTEDGKPILSIPIQFGDL